MSTMRAAFTHAGLIIVAIIAISTLVSRPAVAGIDLGIHLGYMKSRDAESGDGSIGGHLELRPIGPFGIQAAVDHRSVNHYGITAGPVDGTLEVRSVPVTLTGRLYLPMGFSAALFAAGGAGWYHLNYDYSDDLEAIGAEDETVTSFGWHVGGGMEIGLAPRLSVFGEGRVVFMDPNRSLDDDTLQAVEDLDYDSTYFAGGLSVRF